MAVSLPGECIMIEKFIKIMMQTINKGNNSKLCNAVLCKGLSCHNCPLNEENLKEFLSELNTMSKVKKLIKEI